MAEVTQNEDGQQTERLIAHTIEELPPLPTGYVRVVHITHPEVEQDLLKTGLNYTEYGMAMSTGTAWSDATKVTVWSDDPRFSFPGAKALILDIPDEEWKLHNNVILSPGVISPTRIVGFVDAIKPVNQIQT